MTLIGVGEFVVATGADYLLGKAINLVEEGFKSGVIERWSRKRSEAFVSAFCTVVVEGKDETAIADHLAAIMDDEQKSQVLFDAYRRVVLSASPILGPRIIALVTALVVGEGRQPTAAEEKILAAAERMTDAELVEARNWFDKYVYKMERKRSSYFDPGEDEDSAATDLSGFGEQWMVKLGNAGFVTTYIEVKAHDDAEYEEGYVVKRGENIRKVKLRENTYYDAEYKDFAELITRAEKMVTGVL